MIDEDSEIGGDSANDIDLQRMSSVERNNNNHTPPRTRTMKSGSNSNASMNSSGSQSERQHQHHSHVNFSEDSFLSDDEALAMTRSRTAHATAAEMLKHHFQEPVTNPGRRRTYAYSHH